MDTQLLADRVGRDARQPNAGGAQRTRNDWAHDRQGAGRANSRRGTSDSHQTSYPPVESVRRALEVLRTLNRMRIGTVSKLHAVTGLPKPTVVRMLDTLIADGYVVRDNMCGGYRITHRVRELDSGYDGIAQIIEASRPCSIDLTRRIKWPVGIGIFDEDAISIHFWTGAISPWVHTNTMLGHRPTLFTSAMGRVYMAFCAEGQRERLIAAFRKSPNLDFGPTEETEYRELLARIRRSGYAFRAANTEPRRNSTIGFPIRHAGELLAMITVSFFVSAVPRSQIPDQIIEPLRDTVARIEEVIALTRASDLDGNGHVGAGFLVDAVAEDSLEPH